MSNLPIFDVAGSAMTAQQVRLSTVASNLANADSVSETPGGAPYARKIAVFAPVVADNPRDPVGRIVRDTGAFRTRYDPSNVVADRRGYVQLPNVNAATESADLQKVVRNYEANLSASGILDTLSRATLDLLS